MFTHPVPPNFQIHHHNYSYKLVQTFHVLGRILLILLLAPTAINGQIGPPEDKIGANTGGDKIVCYHAYWSAFRVGIGKFTLHNIDPYLCTHLLYVFNTYGLTQRVVQPHDLYHDVQQQGRYDEFNDLKKLNENLKTLLSIGSSMESPEGLHGISANEERRMAFATFLRQSNFDGLDIDWNFPENLLEQPPRELDYALIVEKFWGTFTKEAARTGQPRLLLSISVRFKITNTYILPILNMYVDFLNTVLYMYHSPKDGYVSHYAPLYSIQHISKNNADSYLNTDATIQYYLQNGIDSKKLIMGIPTYGRTYTLANPENTRIGSFSKGPGAGAEFTTNPGYIAYYEICLNIKSHTGWTIVNLNRKIMGPYIYRNDQWICYDDESMVRLKGQYARENDLGGGTFSLDHDDFRGMCHAQSYPLIRAFKDGFNMNKTTSVVYTCRYPPTAPGRICTISKCDTAGSNSSTNCKPMPGAHAEQLTGLSCVCDRGYTLATDLKDVYCIKGQWFPKIPDCIRICEPLKTTSVDMVSCAYNKIAIPCSEPAKVGTVVTIACKKNYIQHPSLFERSVSCLASGQWDKMPSCKPICGISSAGLVSLISGGQTAVKDSVPWHVAIYKTVITDGKENHNFLCGGTIMSPVLIISAAHCFYDMSSNRLTAASEFEIAVGKYTSNYSIIDSPHTKIMKVKQLYIPETYTGAQSNYVSDIAIMELEQIITISDQVMPVCVNWSPTNNTPPRIGKVAGWGYTKTDNVSEFLQVADLPYRSLNECRAMVEHQWFRLAVSQPDKFCAGTKSEAGVREGDSGGGWMYEHEKYYYIFGVVSFKEKNSDGTSTNIAAFTRISSYLYWLDEIKTQVEMARNI